MPDLNKQIREGVWRMIQRIHAGIPGFAGTGTVDVGNRQFTGGNAGVRTAWLIKPYAMPMIDAVPVAGFYLFGQFWPQIFRSAGLEGDIGRILARLDKEFGVTAEGDLRRGTVPIPEEP